MLCWCLLSLWFVFVVCCLDVVSDSCVSYIYLLLVVGRMGGFWFVVVGCLLCWMIVCCLYICLFVVRRCLMLVGCCLDCCVSCVVCCVLIGVCCWLIVGYCLRAVMCWLSWCLLFAVRCELFVCCTLCVVCY